MKALLIGINTKYIHPSISLYQLKANTSYECDICEYIIKDSAQYIVSDISNKLTNTKYDVICFSCYLWNIEMVKSIGSVIKQKFPVVVILGGPEVGYDAKYFLTSFRWIDYIIRGEGEQSFNELLTHLNDPSFPLEKVSNLSYISNGLYTENKMVLCDLNNINLATLMVKDLENQVVYLESNRGCPFHCAYCTASLDNKIRYFPSDKVISILKELMLRKTKTVKFLDRTFNVNKEYMMLILNTIKEYNICTTFQFEIVIDRLSEDVIEFIKTLDHKYLRFEVGIQTMNDDINGNVDRYQNIAKLKKNIASLHDTKNIDIHCDLIAGLPGETLDMFKSSFNDTFHLRCKELQLGFLKFLRGTKLMSMVDKYNYIYNELPPYEIISNNTMSLKDIEEIKLVETSLNYYYNSGRFTRTFKYLFNNKLLNDPYTMFKELSNNINNKQLYNLFTHIDCYFKDNFPNHYNNLNYYLITDYLLNHKTKPKRWWNNLNKDERKYIYSIIVENIPTLSLHDLYQYSVVIKNNNLLFIIIYKDMTPVYYEISI